MATKYVATVKLEGQSARIICDNIKRCKLIDRFILLEGISGIAETSLPHFTAHTLRIDNADIQYIIGGEDNPPAEDSANDIKPAKIQRNQITQDPF